MILLYVNSNNKNTDKEVKLKCLKSQGSRKIVGSVCAGRKIPVQSSSSCQPEHKATAITLHSCHSTFGHSDASWPAGLNASPVHRWQTSICVTSFMSTDLLPVAGEVQYPVHNKTSRNKVPEEVPSGSDILIAVKKVTCASEAHLWATDACYSQGLSKEKPGKWTIDFVLKKQIFSAIASVSRCKLETGWSFHIEMQSGIQFGIIPSFLMKKCLFRLVQECEAGLISIAQTSQCKRMLV